MQKTSDITDSFLVSIELPLWNYERSGITNICRTFLHDSLISNIRLWDEAGNILFEEMDPAVNVPDIATRAVVKHNGQNIGAIELGFVFEQLRDSDSGFRLFNQRVVTGVMRPGLFFKSLVNSEMTLRAVGRGLRYIEVPVSYRQRAGASRGLPPRQIPLQALRVVRDCHRLRRLLATEGHR